MSDELLRVTGLCKSFPTGEGSIQVLGGCDLTVRAGERLAIAGESGVGKSTLLHILGTLDRPTAGSVHCRGDDVFAMTSDQLARFRNETIGFVFQFHHLLPEFDTLENVMIPGLIRGIAFGEMRERAAGRLAEVGLGHRLNHAVGKLSGGERQRVAVARAIVLEPVLLLADEPTGNLDQKHGEQLEDLLLELNRTHGTALVIVTHSGALAEKLGRTLELVDGHLVDRSVAPGG